VTSATVERTNIEITARDRQATTTSIEAAIPANSNSSPPIVILRPTGEAGALYRALARVLVRSELIFANVIPKSGDCEQSNSTG
jgi:hypothetical protein